MPNLYFITHPEVQIDPAIPVSDWRLSERGRDRMRLLLNRRWIRSVGEVWSSTERKACEGAQIVAKALGVTPRTRAGLGENDRSATGYLPKPQFEATADAFFANPHVSIHGWETAADAQQRIVTTIESVIQEAPTGRDIAVISHGAVGTLLLCWLKACPISRSHDQPGTGGGNYFYFDINTRALQCDWLAIDA